MRTVIFIGLLTIAGAISETKSLELKKFHQYLYIIILLLSIYADIADFLG